MNFVAGSGSNNACILIDSSNVVFDCNGQTIDYGASPPTSSEVFGIAVNDNSSRTLTNITIQNCKNITNYNFHVFGDNITNSVIKNVTVYGQYPNWGIRCDNGCSNDVIQNNTVNGGYGGILVLFGGNNNLVDANTVLNNDVVGIEIDSSNTNVTNNRVQGGDTFFTYQAGADAANSRFEFNNATNVGIGFYISAPNAIIRNNIVKDSLGALGGIGFDVFGDNALVSLNYAINNSVGFSVSASGSNVTNNTASLNHGDGFSLSNVIANQNDAHGNTGNGFSMGGTNNASNNNAYSNGGHGFVLSGSGSILNSNVAHDNAGNGFLVSVSDNNSLSNDVAYLNGGDGFQLNDSFFFFFAPPGSFNNVTNSQAYNNNGSGFHLIATDNDNLVSNNATNNSQSGFFLEPGNQTTCFLSLSNCTSVTAYSTLNTLTGNIANQNAQYGFGLISSPSNTLSLNNASGNNFGFYLLSSENNSLSGNTGTGNNFGFYLDTGSNGNSLANNNASGSQDGFRVFFGATGNSLTGNNAFGNTANGFEIDGSDNLLSGNSAFNNNPNGFAIEGQTLSNPTMDNVLVNNVAYGNSGIGYIITANNGTNLTNNTAYQNSYGFYLLSSPSTMVHTAAFSNTADGIVLDTNPASVNLTDTHLFNNGKDLSVFSSVYNTTATVFDNPAGSFQNYTNLSLDDSMAAGEGYSVDWSSLPSPFPAGIGSFNQKFVSIAPISGSPSIDHATWSWLPSEVGSYLETGIQLYEFHSAWAARNVTPDTVNHQLSLSNIANFSTFALVVFHNVSAVKVDVTPLLPSPGGMTQWQINVTNSGAGTLDPVALTDTLPAGLQFVTATPAPDSVSPDNLTANWGNIGPLAPGASAVILLNASVDANASNGTYFNSVNVTATPANGTDVTASDSTPIGIFAPALSVVKNVVTASPITGLNTTFTINITNTGSINLTLSAVDMFPNKTIFRGADVTPTSASNQSATWTNFTVLPVGSSVVITYNVSFISPALYTNNVSVTGYPPNGNSVTDNSSATAAVSSPTAPGGDQGPSQTLSVGMQSNCSGNTITVSSSGAVEGVNVLVDGNSIGTTNSSGQVSFQGCGSSVTIRASASGYQDGVNSANEIACGQCGGPVCTTSADCQPDKACQVNANASLNQCVPVSCSCGVVQDHSCFNYQCCTNADCGAGNVCLDHQCKPAPGCTSDAQCGGDQRCLSPTGAPGTVQAPGACQNITGQCGYVSNHAFIPYNYTCGSEPGCPSCPSGLSCVSHQCISNDISCPSTGVVGENKTCQLTENNTACTPEENCTATVTTPDGKVFGVTPDENGNVQLPLTLQGKYTITLLKDGQVVKQVFVNAVPKSAPTEPEKPAATGPDAFTLLWLLILLAIVVGAVVYWRSRGQKK